MSEHVLDIELCHSFCIDFLHTRDEYHALVQSWLVTVRMESNPCDGGSLVMRLIATVSKGIALAFGYIGLRGALVGQLLTWWHWHSAHPLT